MTQVTVGTRGMDLDEATAFVHRYLNTPAEHWAYPAYDGYPGAPTDALGPQDLLAPTLLNVRLTLSIYDGFIEVLPLVNARLARLPADVDLADADDSALEAIADVVAVLDDPDIPGVRLTTFAKVVHRKRPRLFPLYDEQSRRCYQDGPDAPVPPARRTWRDFSLLWLPEVRRDVREQADTWAHLAALVPPDGPPVSALRALDIVGWRLGEKSDAPGERQES